MRCSTSHVGIALFSTPGFPLQWVLALCDNELFQGRVLCTAVTLNVNGLQEHWKDCNPSLISFNRTATFVGVVRIAVLTQPMEIVQSELKTKCIRLMNDTNQALSDLFVLRTLWLMGKRFAPSSFLTKGEELERAIRAKIAVLLNHQCPPGSRFFPVINVEMGTICQAKLCL